MLANEITPEEYLALVAEEGKRRHKYGAIPVRDPEYGYFPSTGEHQRWHALLQIQRAGMVRNLRRQVPYDCIVGDVKVCRFVVDYQYEEFVPCPAEGAARWELVIEDYKSPSTMTAVYRIKKKLVLACFGMTVRETGKGT